MLEPVWTILSAQGSGEGVGFLRRFGPTEGSELVSELNDHVLQEATHAYGALDLTAPSTAGIWRSISQPSVALLESVRAPGSAVDTDTLEVTVRPFLPDRLLAGQDDTTIVPALRAVLRRWCELARYASGERKETARLTLAAAMLARGAVLDGDTDTVAWFLKRWLGLSPQASRIDGASAALLEGGWVRRRLDHDFSEIVATVSSLRLEINHQHRAHRPVWETQLKGFSVSLLSEPVDASGTELSHTVPTSAVDETDAVDTRVLLKLALATLTEHEQHVVSLIYLGSRTRSDVAHTLGMSASAVDRLVRQSMVKLRAQVSER
ncbi:sigma factor-like helix-turn-helix DNA-binding protein [Actinoplanes regularis]|nr:sigma factor-like helix-turn-helix DNA-binding protein [Actinoplanes regularis]